MFEPTHIQPNELMFYFEEFLNFKGINKPFNFCKSYTKVKVILTEIHSGYFAIFGVISLFGFAYSYDQKYGTNNINDNINGIDIMNMDRAKIRLRIGKTLTIGYVIFNNKNETLDIISILGYCLVSIYATHNVINSPPINVIKM